jgi:hypothetical protein
MTDEYCPDCHRPIATEDDNERYKGGEGEHLCWREYNGNVCNQPSILGDLRTQYHELLEEMDAAKNQWNEAYEQLKKVGRAHAHCHNGEIGILLVAGTENENGARHSDALLWKDTREPDDEPVNVDIGDAIIKAEDRIAQSHVDIWGFQERANSKFWEWMGGYIPKIRIKREFMECHESQ